jgi:hypothetical protein
MLDFTPVRDEEMTMPELVAGLTPDDLRRLTNEMVDTLLDLISDALDADVVFEPEDPEAHDKYAKDEAEVDMPWTLGHVIVHTTASSEEAAAVAAELARGVRFHGRSRSEVPWQTITTIEQCRQRLEESRRIRLASLDMWPDEPYLENTYKYFGLEHINAVTRFVFGLKHADDHLGQIVEIVRQAKVARGA